MTLEGVWDLQTTKWTKSSSNYYNVPKSEFINENIKYNKDPDNIIE